MEKSYPAHLGLEGMQDNLKHTYLDTVSHFVEIDQSFHGFDL